MFVMQLATCADGVKLVKMKGQHGICYETACANEVKLVQIRDFYLVQTLNNQSLRPKTVRVCYRDSKSITRNSAVFDLHRLLAHSCQWSHCPSVRRLLSRCSINHFNARLARFSLTGLIRYMWSSDKGGTQQCHVIVILSPGQPFIPFCRRTFMWTSALE